jgi:broad specificity phosphatase PhoE
MIALYLSHPQVLQDPAIPVTQWALSPQGRARLTAPWAGRITRIFSSPETKALQTAAALRPDLPPEIHDDLSENHRPHYLPPAAFEQAADAFFAHPATSQNGWEPAAQAQSRILQAFHRLSQGLTAPALFTGHGAVGTLLHQALSGHPISRGGDQPGGGGNLYAIDLTTGRPLCAWTPIESWIWPA